MGVCSLSKRAILSLRQEGSVSAIGMVQKQAERLKVGVEADVARSLGKPFLKSFWVKVDR